MKVLLLLVQNYELTVSVPLTTTEDARSIQACAVVRALGAVQPIRYVRLFTRNIRECIILCMFNNRDPWIQTIGSR